MKIKKVKIRWLNRYSDDMSIDRHGRWAIVAYAGKFGGGSKIFVNRWEIAWIRKHNNKFIVNLLFPSQSRVLFENLEDAKKEVEKTFTHFINCCK